MLRKVVKEIGRRLVVAFLIWMVISMAYGFSGTPVENSPLYNPPEIEMRAILVYIPIISLALSVILRIIWPGIDGEVFMTVKQRITRRLARVDEEQARMRR
ncbi:hypothetical protein KKB83_02760 [Patescibacteria group bacterium]|nr:hypothetical protein [Patescibacteria group bacterium]